MRMAIERLPEHFGKALEWASQQPGSAVVQPMSLSVNVVYTGPETTMKALQAAQSFVGELNSTVHIRAMIAVPRQLGMAEGLVSRRFFQKLLSDLVKRVGSDRCEYVLHFYLCRNRIETLLKVLRPSSLVVIGGRRRLWPTAESRLSKAAVAAGHSVAFIETRAF